MPLTLHNFMSPVYPSFSTPTSSISAFTLFSPGKSLLTLSVLPFLFLLHLHLLLLPRLHFIHPSIPPFPHLHLVLLAVRLPPSPPPPPPPPPPSSFQLLFFSVFQPNINVKPGYIPFSPRRSFPAPDKNRCEFLLLTTIRVIT